MARDNWYRHTEWNSDIEAAFFTKLNRARSNKPQYLRIQAAMIARKHPEAALRLLDAYFQLDDHFNDAQAHVHRADAYLALDDTPRAIASLEAALAREEEFPKMITQAWLELPFLIAVRRIMPGYQQALDLLNRHRSRLFFPVDYFRWHAAQALIFSASGQMRLARQHAHQALETATLDHSGLRYHPSLGLVGAQYETIREELARVAA